MWHFYTLHLLPSESLSLSSVCMTVCGMRTVRLKLSLSLATHRTTSIRNQRQNLQEISQIIAKTPRSKQLKYIAARHWVILDIILNSVTTITKCSSVYLHWQTTRWQVTWFQWQRQFLYWYQQPLCRYYICPVGGSTSPLVASLYYTFLQCSVF